MTDAEITDEDRQAAREVIVHAPHLVEGVAQAIANARQAGTQLSTVLAHEAGQQDGLEQAKAIAQKYLDAYSPDIWLFEPLSSEDQTTINGALKRAGYIRDRISGDMGRRVAGNIIDEIRALKETK